MEPPLQPLHPLPDKRESASTTLQEMHTSEYTTQECDDWIWYKSETLNQFKRSLKNIALKLLLF